MSVKKIVKRANSRIRGQAMVEYSIVTHFIIGAGATALLPVISRLYEALNFYYEGVYFVIKSGAM
jgi:hypothetical protein